MKEYLCIVRCLVGGGLRWAEVGGGRNGGVFSADHHPSPSLRPSTPPLDIPPDTMQVGENISSMSFSLMPPDLTSVGVLLSFRSRRNISCRPRPHPCLFRLCPRQRAPSPSTSSSPQASSPSRTQRSSPPLSGQNPNGHRIDRRSSTLSSSSTLSNRPSPFGRRSRRTLTSQSDSSRITLSTDDGSSCSRRKRAGRGRRR